MSLDEDYPTAGIRTVPTGAQTAVTPGKSAKVIIPVPPDTSFFLLRGVVGESYGSLNIAVIPPGPYEQATEKNPYNLNCKGSGVVYDQILFFAPLDPNRNHTIELAPRDKGNIALHSILWYSAYM